MITSAFVRAMVAYNSYMNREVYAAAARLDDEARTMDRGSFWCSIHGTLSHLAWADQMWMSRFDGWDKPNVPLKQSGGFIADFTQLQAARCDMDARLEAWAGRLGDDWLGQDHSWFSNSLNQEVSRARAILCAHLFNHQTHHRGQVHAMITAAGESTGPTDLFVIL